MPTTYTYPPNAVLTRIAQELVAQLTLEGNPIFDIYPQDSIDSDTLHFFIEDNYNGLQHLRGLGGDPIRIDVVGETLYEAKPAYYGDFATIDEVEMTRRGQTYGLASLPAPIEDMVMQRQKQLIVRMVNRVRQICWSLAINGSVTVALPGGGNGYSYSVTRQTSTPVTPWTDPMNSTPLANLRNLQYTYGRGTSGVFDSRATAFMNSRTANDFLANTNAADIGRDRFIGGATINDIPTINRVLMGQNAPIIQTWDDGYLDDSKTFQLDIPDHKVLVMAWRPGNEKPGQYLMTRNAVSKAPGAYSKVFDHTFGPAETIPPKIEVHCGHNGGIVETRTSQLVLLNV